MCLHYFIIVILFKIVQHILYSPLNLYLDVLIILQLLFFFLNVSFKIKTTFKCYKKTFELQINDRALGTYIVGVQNYTRVYYYVDNPLPYNTTIKCSMYLLVILIKSSMKVFPLFIII